MSSGYPDFYRGRFCLEAFGNYHFFTYIENGNYLLKNVWEPYKTLTKYVDVKADGNVYTIEFTWKLPYKVELITPTIVSQLVILQNRTGTTLHWTPYPRITLRIIHEKGDGTRTTLGEWLDYLMDDEYDIPPKGSATCLILANINIPDGYVINGGEKYIYQIEVTVGTAAPEPNNMYFRFVFDPALVTTWVYQRYNIVYE